MITLRETRVIFANAIESVALVERAPPSIESFKIAAGPMSGGAL